MKANRGIVTVGSVIVASATLVFICWQSSRTTPNPSKAIVRTNIHVGTAQEKLTSSSDRRTEILAQLRELRSQQRTESLDTSKKNFGETKLEDQMKSMLRAQMNGVWFSDIELDQIAKIYADYESVRGTFEFEIAEVETTDNKVKITIPEYPQAGQRLRDLFVSDIKKIVGDDRGNAIAAKLGPDLDMLFRGFGQDVQQIEISYVGKTKRGDQALYQITRAEMPFNGDRPAPGAGKGKETFSGSTSTYMQASGEFDAGELAGFTKYLVALTPDKS